MNPQAKNDVPHTQVYRLIAQLVAQLLTDYQTSLHPICPYCGVAADEAVAGIAPAHEPDCVFDALLQIFNAPPTEEELCALLLIGDAEHTEDVTGIGDGSTSAGIERLPRFSSQVREPTSTVGEAAVPPHAAGARGDDFS